MISPNVSCRINARRRVKPGRLLLSVMCFLCLGQLIQGVAVSQTRSERVAAILRRAMKDRNIPGLQAAVVLDGRVVFSRSYGVANLQTPVPVTSRTLFSINSITKALTGVAVMEEVEKGRLDLSVPISNYLDDIPPAWGKVSTRQLLGQVSGLPDIFDYDDSELTGIRDEQAAWSWALTQPVSLPGEKENYCQTNLRLVQMIINQLEGRAPDASLIDEQLSRAGMVTTVYGDSREVIKNKSQPYGIRDDGVLENHFELFGPMMHANSGLNTTADDMARWMISILNGKQISDSSRDVMWTLVPLNDGSLSSFALGWGVEKRPNYTSVGMEGGARSAFAIYPRYNVGVVILTNLMGASPEDLTDEVAAVFAPEIKLSAVAKLRADAERNGFHTLSRMLEKVQTSHGRESFDELELESWIQRLSFGKKRARALEVAKFNAALFPSDSRALERLAQAYQGDGKPDEEARVYRELISLDPNNAVARRFFDKH